MSTNTEEKRLTTLLDDIKDILDEYEDEDVFQVMKDFNSITPNHMADFRLAIRNSEAS